MVALVIPQAGDEGGHEDPQTSGESESEPDAKVLAPQAAPHFFKWGAPAPAGADSAPAGRSTRSSPGLQPPTEKNNN